MTTVFHTWVYDISRAISGERNLTEQIKAPIFLEVVLAIEIMKEPQSNLEEKLNPSILGMIFPQGQTHPYSHQ